MRATRTVNSVQAMRSTAVTLLVAIAVGGGTLLVGWSVQAAGLPRPERGDAAAINALTMLRRYHVVTSRFSIDGGRVLSGRCAAGWFPRRGTLLTLDDGTQIFATARTHLTPRALLELELAGCPRILPDRLENLVQQGNAAHAAPTWAGRPALAVRIQAPHTTFTLDVAPKVDVPLGLHIVGPLHHGTSRIRLVRLP